MSIESAQEFIERIATDEAFQQSIVNTVGDKEGDAAAEAVVMFGEESGFTFTHDELLQAQDALSSLELDEKSLDSVTGGGFLQNMRNFMSDVQKKTHDTASSIIDNIK